ncbi:MAG: zinc-binding dehydrogenase [Bacteroidetes bacterium]|nr:zinc-binding dehydrogenase [Bacteroidota bacterium]
MNNDELLKKIAGLSPEKKEALLRRLGYSSGKSVEDVSKTLLNKQPVYDCFNCDPGNPGSLNFSFREAVAADPPAGYIQVRAKAAGLNYRDLMIAMGQYPEAPGVPSNMGSDYSGVVTRVGPGVKEISEGDEVIALSAGTFIDGKVQPVSHFINLFNLSELQVVPKPPFLSFAEAAALPTVFLTAFSGLIRLANLTGGESVLIHTATGGVGLAALEIAGWKKAKIYATAGSPEKREFLKQKGVLHPMDSRSTAFGDEIMELTKGRGVDVVLNTLSGNAMMKGIEILSPFGRFIQIDKKDIARNTPLPMKLLRNGITFAVLDISLYLIQPRKLKEQLLAIAALFNAGVFKPIPCVTFPVGQVKEALNALSRSKHIGKLVLTYP